MPGQKTRLFPYVFFALVFEKVQICRLAAFSLGGIMKQCERELVLNRLVKIHQI